MIRAAPRKNLINPRNINILSFKNSVSFHAKNQSGPQMKNSATEACHVFFNEKSNRNDRMDAITVAVIEEYR